MRSCIIYTKVTVKQFADFVQATGYVSDAERLGGLVYNFQMLKWEIRADAYWAFPHGKDFPKALASQAVTQVLWNDAQAYCQWAKKKLPSVLEWEYAAQAAGKYQRNYPWGNQLCVEGKFMANVWQGAFPEANLCLDKHRFVAPVKSFPPSELGLYDLSGNVWEWTSDSMLVDGHFEYIQKGGSFMCEQSVCHGFQISGQTSSNPPTALFHLGFRTIRY